MKAINKDAVLAGLRCHLREAKEKKNGGMATITQCVITIIEGMPEVNVDEGVNCGRCFFYDAEAKRCIHRNGLNGRVRPGMFCSYGSLRPNEGDFDEEPDDEDWSEFDED